MTITELETFFASRDIPKTVQLRQGETIIDTKAFLHSHLLAAKSNNRIGVNFLDRLIRLKEVLEVEETNHQSV